MTEVSAIIRQFLRKSFDIRDGEISRALLMQLNIFLIISALLILKPTVSSLFLSRFGAENLPNLFLLVAFTAIAVSVIYSRILNSIPLNKIIQVSQYISLFILMIFWVLLTWHILEGVVIYLFYLWVSIFALLSTSQFWILANLVFNAREAKRLFGFIGAGAIAGGIFGGYLASILVFLIHSENLLIVCMLLLAGTIPINKKIWKENVSVTQTKFQLKKKMRVFSDSPLKLIIHSKHLTLLASIIGISVIASRLVEYLFGAISTAEITDPNTLTAFFGFWFSTLNIASLLIQLFLTRKVVGVFGVGTSLLFLPSGILFGALFVFAFPVLWTAILIKVCDGSLKQSINKAGIELLALPIPAEIKSQTKSFIDIFIDSLATGIGGIILIVLINAADFSARFVSLILMALTGFWFHLVIKLRKEYINTLKIKIDPSRSPTTKKEVDFKSESVLGGLRKVLETGTERQLMFVLNRIKEVQHSLFIPGLETLLRHARSEIRMEALRNLYFYRHHDASAQILPLIEDPVFEIKVEAFNYIFERTDGNSENFVEGYIGHPDYQISTAALLSLAIETRDNPPLRESYDLENLIHRKLKILENEPDAAVQRLIKTNCIKAIGSGHISNLYSIIHDALLGTDPDIVSAGVYAAGQSQSSGFLKKLFHLHNEEAFEKEVRDALIVYGPGIIDTLNDWIASDASTVALCMKLMKIYEKIGTQKSVNALFDMLQHEDIALRNRALLALTILRTTHSHLRFDRRNVLARILEEAELYHETISVLYVELQEAPFIFHPDSDDKMNPKQEARKSLIDLLEKRLDGNIERIFRLLSLSYLPDDMLSTLKSIQSKKAEQRNDAIEFLDNLLDSNLKRIVLPIVEASSLSALTEEVLDSLKIKIMNEFECLQTLLKGTDPRIQLATLYLIIQLKDEQYRGLLESMRNDPSPKIRTFVERALIATSYSG